jgi:hypothetical protein
MQKVVGSSPIARSSGFTSIVSVIMRRGTQVAKGEVCKTSIRRFESDPRLHTDAPSVSTRDFAGGPHRR